MGIIREKIDASEERRIIIYAITSTEFLKGISQKARVELFRAPYAKTVFSWISQYFKEFEKAPVTDIQDMYMAHRAEVLDSGDNDVIQEFLQSLSEEYEKTITNVSYAIKQAKKWLDTRALENIRDKLDLCIKSGEIENGLNAVTSFTHGQDIKLSGVDIFDCGEELIEAFSEENEFLFRFPGFFGKVAGDFCRGDFVAFTAFAKRGKSHALLSCANQGLYYGKNVLFISLEMPLHQVLRREWMALKCSPEYDRTVKIPFFVQEDTDTYSIDYETKDMKRIDFSPQVYAEWKREFLQYFRRGSLRIESMPARTATVEDIRAYVENLEYYDNWMPDIIVLDYADLLTSKLKGEPRHQLDDIWSKLRGFAMEKNICIITASQSGRGSANSDVTEESIAEDIRKIAHVTKMIALNATQVERNNGIMRVKQLAERGDSCIFEQCVLLNCLDIGQFFLDSLPLNQVVYKRDR